MRGHNVFYLGQQVYPAVSVNPPEADFNGAYEPNTASELGPAE